MQYVEINNNDEFDKEFCLLILGKFFITKKLKIDMIRLTSILDSK
jgi:hypothetical protein